MKRVEIPTFRYSNIVWVDSDNPKYNSGHVKRTHIVPIVKKK